MANTSISPKPTGCCDLGLGSLIACLDSIDDTLLRIEEIVRSSNTNLWLINQTLPGLKMDKKIKAAKKSMDKKMDNLVKEDVKRDKKCEHEDKMTKKNKKKK